MRIRARCGYTSHSRDIKKVNIMANNVDQLKHSLEWLEYAADQQQYAALSTWARDVASIVNRLEKEVDILNDRFIRR